MPDNRYKILGRSRFRQKEASNNDGSLSLFEQYGGVLQSKVLKTTNGALTPPQFAGITTYRWTAKTIDGSPADGSPVTNWTDTEQSVTLNAAIPAREPTYRENYASSGYPAIEFDGTSDYLLNNTNPIHTTNLSTLFFVVRGQVYNTGEAEYLVAGGSAGRHGVATHTSTRFFMYAGVVAYSAGGQTMVNKLYKARFNETSSDLFADGVQVITGKNVGTQVRKGLVVGGAYDGSLYVEAAFHEVISYDGLLSVAQEAEVETYLTAEWGL